MAKFVRVLHPTESSLQKCSSEGLWFLSVFPVFPVLRYGLPGGCCDGWLIDHLTHLWSLPCAEYLSSSLLLSCCQIVAYPYVVQLWPTSGFLCFSSNRAYMFLFPFACQQNSWPITEYSVALDHWTLEPLLLLPLYKARFLEKPALVHAQHRTRQYFVFSLQRITHREGLLFSRTDLCVLPQILISLPESPFGLKRFLFLLLLTVSSPVKTLQIITHIGWASDLSDHTLYN